MAKAPKQPAMAGKKPSSGPIAVVLEAAPKKAPAKKAPAKKAAPKGPDLGGVLM